MIMRSVFKQSFSHLFPTYLTPQVNIVNISFGHPFVASRLFGTNIAGSNKSSSRYVGVSWSRHKRKWRASIQIERTANTIGSFENEKDAAEAYDECAGPLGRAVNFPKEGQKQAMKRGAHGIVSKFTGLHWDVSSSRWRAMIRMIRPDKSAENVHLGFFKSEVEAAKAYDDRAAAVGRPVNFPAEGQTHAIKMGSSVYMGAHWNGSEWEAFSSEGSSLGTFDIEMEAARAYDDHLVASRGLARVNFPEDGAGELRQATAVPASKYVGVKCQPSMQGPRWVAVIDIDGKTVRLGSFDCEEEAAEAYDEKAGPLGRPVNKPKNGQVQAKKRGSSKFRGVKWVRGKWASSIGIDGKSVRLGTFEDEETAARVYDDRAATLGRPVNFPTLNSEISWGGGWNDTS